MLVGFHLCEVGVDGEVRGQRRGDGELGVDSGLPANVAARRLPADAVVLGLHGAAECIRVQLEIVGAVELSEVGDGSFIVQVVESLGAAVRAPQVLLVLPPNEAPDIEPELRGGAGVKPQREQRDAELRRPSFTITRDGDLPDAVPVVVQVIDARELGVPHGAVRVRAEHERAAAVVEAVDQEPDVIVTRKVGIAAELAGPQRAHIGVVAAHRDVQRRGVVGHLDDRALRGGGPLTRFALAEVVDRVRRHPHRFVEPAVERQRSAEQCGANRRWGSRAAPGRGAQLLGRADAGDQAEPRERDG